MTSRDVTSQAFLPCRGGTCPGERPARHRFLGFAERYVAGILDSVDTVYRCDECGHDRVWGTLDPVVFRTHLVH